MKCMNQPWIIKEYELNVSVSIGVVRYPEDGKSTIDLMKSADIAMYRAKKQGIDPNKIIDLAFGDSQIIDNGRVKGFCFQNQTCL